MKHYKEVSEFIADLETEKKEQVLFLRDTILKTHPNLKEHIKWNAPSYVFDDQDRITFNLLNKENKVKLVLHMGVSRTENKNGTPIMADPSKLIIWQSDIRGILTFDSLSDIKSKHRQISTLISNWLSLK